jgi:hypothetical protein
LRKFKLSKARSLHVRVQFMLGAKHPLFLEVKLNARKN